MFSKRRAMQSDINVLLTQDKERGEVFEKVHIIGLRRAKTLKDILVRAKVKPLEEKRKTAVEH